MSFTAQHFVFETPLYESIHVPWARRDQIAHLKSNGSVRIDGYCVECGQSSVFHSSGGKRFPDVDELAVFSTFELICQRNPAHRIRIFVQVSYSYPDELLTVMKIGQLPSHADIANGSLKEYASVLNDEDRREFVRANGLAAHGVNIGAFVYLRRLFERLLMRARARAGDAVVDEAYNRARVSERIELLAEFLPPFMVENKGIYSVLSNGIHELTEDECANYYELLRTSCLVMLEQEREMHDRDRLLSDLSTAIAKIPSS